MGWRGQRKQEDIRLTFTVHTAYLNRARGEKDIYFYWQSAGKTKRNISWANLPWVNTRPNKTSKYSRMAIAVIQYTEQFLSAVVTFDVVLSE